MASFSALDWQKKIYLNGFSGQRSKVPIDLHVLEEKARNALSPKAFAYVAGGAGIESTIRNNRSAFENYKIIPHMLNDVSVRDTSIDLFGQRIPSPLLLSPVGVLELVHPDADVAVGRAASKAGLPYIFSNQASKPMEEIAAAMSNSPRWFQLYWGKSPDLVASFVQRAERCGCSAIVVTLDTTMLGWRTRDLDLAYVPFLEGKGIAQYTSDPVFQKLMDEAATATNEKRNVNLQMLRGLINMVNAYPGKGFFRKLKSGRPVKAVQKFLNVYSNPALTWEDLKFLRVYTKLPILLKGILHEDDARKAIDYGMDGILISNHGGRQVDGSVGTLEVLPAISSAVNNKIPILLDGGVRGGADMFKAIALGATAVCIGRPYAYGLALAGEQGVYEVLQNFMADFELTMGLAGCSKISDLSKECLL